MRKFCFFLVGVVVCAATADSQTFSCPIGQEDMLNYFVMAYPNRVTNFMGPGNANPVYSSITPDYLDGFAGTGYFVWTKSLNGYPWDVKSFDTQYVYDRTTELSWNDPQSFKRFDQDMPITKRCVKIGKAGAAIKVTSANTSYGFYKSCAKYQSGTLNYAWNTLTSPKLIGTPGNMGQISTRLFKYHYDCDSTYANCHDMEVFSLGYQVGLYDWKHYTSQNGKWVLQQESSINNFDVGQTTPYLPCTSSYE
jgi:hypothetical protein